MQNSKPRRKEPGNHLRPPHSPETEEAALGSALDSQDAAVTLVEKTTPEDFYDPQRRRARAAIEAILKRGHAVDAITVTAELRTQGMDDPRPFVAELLEQGKTPWHLDSYIATLREQTFKRDYFGVVPHILTGTTNGKGPDYFAGLIAYQQKLLDSQQKEAQAKMQVQTARQLCELPDPDNGGELLGPFVVKGQRIVCGAHTGHGKTTLGLQVVRAVVNRSEFLGWRGAGGKALVIDAEQGLRTIKRRLHEAGLDDSDAVDYLCIPDGLSLDKNPGEVSALKDVLAAGHYAIVFADPLYKLHTGDSNSERDAVDLMKVFDRWRADYDFALFVPIHCRKPPIGAKFTMHEFFASTAFLRGAEVIVGLQMMSAGYSRLHWFKDRDGDLTVGEVWPLLFDREQGFRRDSNADARRIDLTVADVVAACRDSGGVWDSLVRAAEALDVSHGVARRACEVAVLAGDLEPFKGPRNASGYRLRGDGLWPS